MTRPWSTLPRIPLATFPRRSSRLHRFGEAIGAEVWIKRDDIGPIGLAGNKVRKLEYVLAEARAQGADTIVIIGAEQSNAARATAAACAQLGLRCVLVLSGHKLERRREPAAGHAVRRGGPLRGRSAGPSCWHARSGSPRQARRRRATYTLPAGSSSPLGAVGFAAAWFELTAQLDEPAPGPRPSSTPPRPAAPRPASRLGARIGGHQGPELRAIGVDSRRWSLPDVPGYIGGLADGAAGVPMERGRDRAPSTSNWLPGRGYASPTRRPTRRSAYWPAPRRSSATRSTWARRWPR